jgi:hypothetical protein
MHFQVLQFLHVGSSQTTRRGDGICHATRRIDRLDGVSQFACQLRRGPIHPGRCGTQDTRRARHFGGKTEWELAKAESFLGRFATTKRYPTAPDFACPTCCC